MNRAPLTDRDWEIVEHYARCGCIMATAKAMKVHRAVVKSRVRRIAPQLAADFPNTEFGHGLGGKGVWRDAMEYWAKRMGPAHG